MSNTTLLTHQDLKLLQQQAAELSLQQQHQGSSRHEGPFLTRRRGSGMELEELRHYQFGDDVRHMAWRATARSGTPVMKVFRAEQQTRMLLVIEQHPGMLFGSLGELKATSACRCAALLGLAAQSAGADVGAVIPGHADGYFAYSNRRETLLNLINHLNRPPREASTPEPQRLFPQLTNLSRRGERIFLISDFSHWNDTHANALRRLADHADVHALQIVDRGEQHLPAGGRLRLRSPFDGNEIIIDSDNPHLRNRYDEAMQERQAALNTLFTGSGVHHVTVHTDKDPLPTLAGLL